LLASTLSPDTLAADARALREGEIVALSSTSPSVATSATPVALMCSLPPNQSASRWSRKKGRFVAVFREEADGSWKVIQDIHNAESATSK
jgi:hypothetical protein